MSFAIFKEEQVRSVLNWPMVNEAVEEALKALGRYDPNPKELSDPYAHQPQRSITVGKNTSSILLTMPGFVGNFQLTDADGIKHVKNALGCKLVTSFSNNNKLEVPLPNIMANIAMFSTETGQLQYVMEGSEITAWRTAAASNVATKLLFLNRLKEERGTSQFKVGIIGTGIQGSIHARGMCATFNVSDIYLWNRSKTKAEILAVHLRIEAPKTKVHIVGTVDEAVQDADVICIATYSSTALIKNSMLIKKDVHINAIGAGEVHFGEVDNDIYKHANVYVDSWEGAKKELHNLQTNIVSDLSSIIRGEKSVPSTSGVTIFQSMGVASEDVVVCQAVYDALQYQLSNVKN